MFTRVSGTNLVIPGLGRKKQMFLPGEMEADVPSFWSTCHQPYHQEKIPCRDCCRDWQRFASIPSHHTMRVRPAPNSATGLMGAGAGQPPMFAPLRWAPRRPASALAASCAHGHSANARLALGLLVGAAWKAWGWRGRARGSPGGFTWAWLGWGRPTDAAHAWPCSCALRASLGLTPLVAFATGCSCFSSSLATST